MFKVLIAGKNMIELRSKVIEFLAGMDDFTEPSKPSQEVLPRAPLTPPPPVENPFGSLPPAPMAMPGIPVAPAPVAAPVASPINMEYGVDSRGLPWDTRIHAVTQGVNKDGSWRYRRGVEKNVIDQVEQELRSKVGAPVAATPAIPASFVIPQAPAPFVPPVVLQPAPAAPVPAPPIQQPVVAPAPAPVAPVLSAHTLETFKTTLVATLARLVQEGKLTHEYVQSLKNYFGVEQIWQLSEPQFAEMFENFCKAGLIVKAQ